MQNFAVHHRFQNVVLCKAESHNLIFHESITKRNALKKLVSKITDTQLNFTSQEKEKQKYRSTLHSELSVIEATAQLNVYTLSKIKIM